MNIVFTNTLSKEFEPPELASKNIPDWYKNMESYMGGTKKLNGHGINQGTIKRCMPVFDAMTAGYLILLPADVNVSIKEYTPTDPKTGEVIPDLPTKMMHHFEWCSFNTVGFHPVEQAPDHPLHNGNPYPKWMNPWSIRTPKGYSTLFVQPMHRDAPFTIMPGVVDTDKYFAPVNLPMVINDPDFEGLIPKGTPIAQVIPFKRDSWELQLGGQKELEDQKKVADKNETKLYDKYKSMFRVLKEYK
jgi:hypothetical protein